MKRDADSGARRARPFAVSGYEEANVPQQNRALGELIREVTQLSDQQIEQIVAYQRQHKTRFGEAAIALNMASREDVLQALARQFQYSYTPAISGPDAHNELVVATDPFCEGAEAFRELRSQLLMGALAKDPNTPKRALAVLSPDVSEGKTYVAANLAVAMSQLGGRTLLLDADMRTPRIHEICNVQSDTGLSGILSGRSDRNALRQIRGLPGLFVLPVGGIPPNPLELLQRPVFGLLLHEALQKFDHVIIDTPAAVHGADARVVAAKAGAALLVGRKNHSRIDGMQELTAKLAKSPMVMAGVVINDF